MSTHKNIDKICIGILIAALVLTLVFMNGSAFGIEASARVMGYENRLFDTSRVHAIDIVIDDWDGFLENCENEEYSSCAAVIDGESYKNVAIRAKGNTSLSQVKQMDSSRYSFKLEFDHYNSNETYHGLDKLCLNNIIQDNTFMKDYLTYRWMYEMGADAPLASYAFITVNGEDWGLYLAVEAVEDSFLTRNYGNDTGDLYKPDSQSMGGGRGEGQRFDISDFLEDLFGDEEESDETEAMEGGAFYDEGVPAGETGEALNDGQAPPDKPDSDGHNERPEGGDEQSGNRGDMGGGDEQTGHRGGMGGGFGGGGGMGSDDVKLKYTDDDEESYSNIFDNAKTTVNEADKSRLIASLKKLGEVEDIEEVVDTDEVIRYFVVHNFVVNGDSYTGQMIHNYYLREKGGQMSMIPWDYNLAFGTFQGNNASSAVNQPVDSPILSSGMGGGGGFGGRGMRGGRFSGDGDNSADGEMPEPPEDGEFKEMPADGEMSEMPEGEEPEGGEMPEQLKESGADTFAGDEEDMSDRPMVAWIFSDETYTELYHQYMGMFLKQTDFSAVIEETAALIAPYVERDPTKFCTYDEFEAGAEAIKRFCELRAESVSGQLDGVIPSTTSGQSADDSALVDTGDLMLSDMGTMSNGGGGGDNRGGGPGGGVRDGFGGRSSSDGTDSK